MNPFTNKLFIAGMTAAIGLLGLSSCSDDHFDLKITGTATQTLWQGISQNPKLDSLKQILERSYFTTNSRKYAFDFTYARLLDTDQSFTLFAPIDGSYDAKSILLQLDSVNELHQRGEDSLALDLNTRISNHFINQHLSRFSHASAVLPQSITMFNGKELDYDPVAGTLGSIPLLQNNASIAARNGELKLIDGRVAYLNNLKDYILEDPMNKAFAAYIAKFDTSYFSPQSSTPGAIYNGRIQYLDSVTIHSNFILPYGISNEDSLYVAVVPNEKAIQAFTSRLANYNKMKSSYKYSYDGNKKFFTEERKYSAEQIDSLKQLKAVNFIFQYFKYSTSNFLVDNNKDSAQVVQYAINSDSLGTTFSRLYNETPGKPNPFFLQGTPIRLSNAFVIPSDSFALPLSAILKETNTPPMVVSTDGVRVPDGERVRLTSDNRNDSIEGLELLHQDSYLKLESFGGQVQAYFRLPNILSTNYQISIITVPEQANLADFEQGDEPKDFKFQAQILDDSAGPTGKPIASSSTFTVSQTKVDTVVLFDDFKFDYSYDIDNLSTFPILRIRGVRNQSGSMLNVAAIIIRPKELDRTVNN